MSSYHLFGCGDIRGTECVPGCPTLTDSALVPAPASLLAVPQDEDRAVMALARNIVNQILDESGAGVKKRQAINDRCDQFTYRLIADLLEAAKAGVWDEGYNHGFYDRDYMRTDESRDATEGRTHNPYDARRDL